MSDDKDSEAEETMFIRAALLLLTTLLLLVIYGFASSLWGWWARGHAMSAWVKAKHRVEIPWYEAGYLPIDAKDFSLQVTDTPASDAARARP